MQVKCFEKKTTTKNACQMSVDAQGVLVGVRLLVTSRFQPSPLASKLCAAPQKEEQSVSLLMPAYSLATSSPMQCLLVEAGVIGYRVAPTRNLQRRLLYNPTVERPEEEETPNVCERLYKTYVAQGWIRRKRRKLPTAVTADEIVQVIFCPNGRSGGRGEDSHRL